MYASAGRGRARADEEARIRRGVGIERRERAGDELHEVVRAAADVAADEVRVVRFVLRAVSGVARQDAVAEAGSESLDLRLDGLAHVLGRPVRHMAVRPAGVLAGGRARVVEHALLRDEHERLLRGHALPGRRLVRGDLLERPTHVYRRRSPALLGLPWNRTVEGVVDLEDAGTVA